jgi:DNA mismatch repair protein MSH2
LSKYTKEETNQGTDLIREFLDTWKERVESLAQGEGDDGGVSEEKQVEELRKLAKEYGGRFDDNKWIEGLMAGL